MFTKQQMALIWSVESLAKTSGKLYLWRFSWAGVYNMWYYPRMWKKFTDDLSHVVPDYTMGIRVVERFPGNNQYDLSHGLHYHVVFNQRIDVRQVWRLCRKHGMGCHVQKVKGDVRATAVYVAKYLTKDVVSWPVRIRRWGSVFGAFNHCVNDIKLVHPHSDSVKYLTKFWGRGQFGREQICSIYNSVNCSGDWKTLMVALDYKERRRMDSFEWSEPVLTRLIRAKPFRDWIDYDATIWRPGRMPDLLEVGDEF
jgi:hypothetical protein